MAQKSREEAIRLLKEHAPPEPLEAAVSRVRTVALQVVASEQAMAVKETLTSDDEFRRTSARHLAGLVNELAGIDAALFEELLLSSESISESITQTAFLKIRPFLERRPSSSLNDLESSLREVLVLRSIVKGLTSLIRSAFPKESESTESKLAALVDRPLYSDAAIAGILGYVAPLRDSTATAGVEKLVSRLRNDRAFSRLLQDTPNVAFPEVD